MTDQVTVFKCESIGVSGTTDTHVHRKPDGKFEARCGIALFGSTQMDEDGFKACNYDPFHDQFYDNYAKGIGDTEAEAIDALKINMRKTADSIWI